MQEALGLIHAARETDPTSVVQPRESAWSAPTRALTFRARTVRQAPGEDPHPGPCGRGTVAMAAGRLAGLSR